VDNQEALVTVGAQDIGRRQTTQKAQHIFMQQLYYFVYDALHISEHQHFNLNSQTYANIDDIYRSI
jgi:hypothetical protein